MIHARDDYNRIQDPEGRIPDNEPVFLIRGQDVVAPDVVEFWATKAHEAGVDSRMVEAARKHASRMRRWQAEHGSKIPDLS